MPEDKFEDYKVQDPISAVGTGNPMEPIGFPVAPKKFWIMSICTCFLYPVYWAYQNFRHLNVTFNTKVWAAVYAFFLPISFNALMKGLQSTAAEYGASVELKTLSLAISFFVLQAIEKILDRSNVPIGGLIVGVISMIPLYQALKKINAVNAELRPDLHPDSAFTPWDIIGIIIMGGLLILSLISGFLPKQ